MTRNETKTDVFILMIDLNLEKVSRIVGMNLNHKGKDPVMELD